MADYTTTHTASTPSVRHIRGRSLAKLPRYRRLQAALALIDGKAVLDHCIRQAAAACRVPEISLRRELAARKPKPKPPTLAEHLVNSTTEEKVEAARVVGVDFVWDQMILPLITTAAEDDDDDDDDDDDGPADWWKELHEQK
jgi:hypothetical protein